MDSYKSLASVNPQPWIDHFKKSIDRSCSWSPSTRPKAVLIDSKHSRSASSVGDDLPIEVVEPIEQNTARAKAELLNDVWNEQKQSHPGGHKGQKSSSVRKASMITKSTKALFTQQGNKTKKRKTIDS